MSVCLVVPCFNEEKRLRLDLFGEALQDPSLNILFVNDGSSDATSKLLRDFAANSGSDRVATLDLPHNVGKAEAVRAGMNERLAQSSKYAGFWDADLATPLSELPRFVALLEEEPRLEVVLGSRVKLLGREIERRALRHYLGRVAATAISHVLRLAVYDTQCGAKLFRNNAAMSHAFADPFSSRWIFDVEIIARYAAFHRQREEEVAERIAELPLMRWRDVAGSNVRAADFLRAGSDLWKIRKRYRL